MATDKTTTKKAASKAKTKQAAKPTAEKRIEALEKRIAVLEERDIVTKAEDIYSTTSNKVKESYDENPGLTIVIGLGILVVLLLIIT